MKRNVEQDRSQKDSVETSTPVALPDLSAPPKGIRVRSRVRAGLLACGDGTETC